MTPPTVLLPAFRRVDSTRRALASLAAAGAARVVLIDDEGLGDGPALARDFPNVEVLTTAAPVFWTGAIALGIRHARERGDGAVLFFNQDVRMLPGYFERLAETAARSPGAVIGAAVLYAHEPDTVWSAGGRMEWWGRGPRVLFHGAPAASLPAKPFAADWLFGMGTYVPMSVFDRAGLPDAARFPMAWGDTDFSLRVAAAGIPVLVDPALRLVHEVGGYDARAAGPPSAGLYVAWLRDPRHNLSLAAHAEIWRRHGPRHVWPLALAARAGHLLANYLRIRVLFPGEGREP